MELMDLTAAELVRLLGTREVSSRELTEAHLARIEEHNPAINAIVTVDAEAALAAADKADEEAARGGSLGPLHGLPMTHKDTHMVAGMRSTNGSPVFADHVPARDDLIIARLRAAGVVPTGKSNVPEFGAGSHTFNEVFGTTTNPYAPTLSAGGSSGGVSAAVAARIQPLGDGSDMGGSLRIPASFCNVVGFRPSLGVIPMPSPVNAWAWIVRTGPIARTVEDIALFMSAVAGPSEELQLQAPAQATDFTLQTSADLRGVRVGFTRDFGLGVPVEQEVLDVFDAQLAVFESLGAVVEESTIDFREADRVFGNTRALEFAGGIGPVVEQHRELVKPEVIWNVEKGWALDVREILATRAAGTRLQQAVRAYFRNYDLLVSPTAQVLPFDATLRYPQSIRGVASETYLDWMRSACLLSATGLPAISMPAGFSAGLPVGIQIAANHHRDPQLLRWAACYEAATNHAQIPPAAILQTEPAN